MMEYKKHPDEESQVEGLLHPIVKQWFYSRFKSFSLPQRYGVSEIHKRKNILISAPTGATKTLTAFLSILNELTALSMTGNLKDKVYCIYISPLKALNNDIEKNLKEPLEQISDIAGKRLKIRTGVRTGDTTTSQRASMLKTPPHILITTPESLALMLSSVRFHDLIKDVEWVVVDEVHAIADSKRGVHLSLSLERLHRLSPFCRIGLSATVAPLEEVAKYLVGYQDGSLRPCMIVDIQFLKEMDLKVLSPVQSLIDTTHERMHNRMYDLIHELIQQHRTTLIFTNTRAATERVVHTLKEKYPKEYAENIGAHHGSLSKTMRFGIEQNLRAGKLKVVVSSTSLELGIDIGYIDLVLLLGSPKSVARALQRIGRSGHQLHSTTKGRIIVLDRDDLVECAVLLKNAVEKRIDKIQVPKNALDVLAQHIFGIALEGSIHIHELYNLVRGSYCYDTLKLSDFQEVIDYLAGSFANLEARHIYAKIWYDKESGMIGKRGKLARVIYMTNIGTIPDESHILVKIGEEVVGSLDEGFLERLKKGDVFVLGGQVYEFLYSKGMVAQVKGSVSRPPTVPRWASEMLPLSFDLAMEIQKFRRHMDDLFRKKAEKETIVEFLNSYLYVDENSAEAIYAYFREQYSYSLIPHDKRIVVEYVSDNKRHYALFHTLFGRRTNDALSRAIGFALTRLHHKDMEIGINDNGFYLASSGKMQAKRALMMLNPENIRSVLERAIDTTEVLKRRFRHCAMRSLMILRNYQGTSKSVGKQQMSSQLLLSAVKRINEDFCILKEARREVLEDLMDINHAEWVIRQLQEEKMMLVETSSDIPSPFAFNLAVQGYSDILRIEDRVEFLRRMHQAIVGKIEESKPITISLSKTRDELWQDRESAYEKNKPLIDQLYTVARTTHMPGKIMSELMQVLTNKREASEQLIEYVRVNDAEFSSWPLELRTFLRKIARQEFSYDDFWEEMEHKKLEETEAAKEILIAQIYKAASKEKLEMDIVAGLIRLVEGERKFPKEFVAWLDAVIKGPIKQSYADDLARFLAKARKEIKE